MTCEDFKKRLNQVSATLDEKNEKKQGQIHKAALEHLQHVKKERLFYKANAKVAHEYYRKIGSKEVHSKPSKSNSRNIMSHLTIREVIFA